MTSTGSEAWSTVIAVDAECELLDWDTTFWGFPVATVRASRLSLSQCVKIDSWCREHAVRCLYFLGEADDLATEQTAREFGFELVDVRFTFERAVAPSVSVSGAPANGVCIRNGRPEDLDTLRDVARNSYQASRFYADTHFPRERCDALYDVWLSKSFAGYADAVFVALLDERVVGYICCTMREHDTVGEIGLIGVSQVARGQGVGQALVNHALGHFSEQGATLARVVTQQRNVRARELYTRTGFQLVSAQPRYHKWYSPRSN